MGWHRVDPWDVTKLTRMQLYNNIIWCRAYLWKATKLTRRPMDLLGSCWHRVDSELMSSSTKPVVCVSVICEQKKRKSWIEKDRNDQEPGIDYYITMVMIHSVSNLLLKSSMRCLYGSELEITQKWLNLMGKCRVDPWMCCRVDPEMTGCVGT